jgi:alanine or glycine:cation symporter, AGCS family
MNYWVETISDFLWGPWTVLLLVLLGFLMTLASRGIQFRKFTLAIRLVAQGAFHKDRGEKEAGDISPFQALTTAMAATIGNGNIAGVATAIAIGGPGAAFWMVFMAPLGMATKFSETVLSLKYRKKTEDGSMLGGPMSYLKDGLGLPTIGAIFALCATLGGLGAGNIAQANSISLVLATEFNVAYSITGVLLAIVLGIVIIGGIKRIGHLAENLVPTMVVLYSIGVLVIIIANIDLLPSAIQIILTSAFEPVAPIGGFAGASVARTIEYGIRRGVISSEAGVGSAGIAHSAAQTKDPLRQGYISMIGVFIDTMIVCSMTAITVVITGVWNNGETSTAMVATAFNSTIPYGGIVIALCSLLFGFTTMVTWAYYGEQGIRFVTDSKIVIYIFRVVWCIAAYLGSVYEAKLIWDLGDIMIACMMFPNLVGLFGLIREIRVITDTDTGHVSSRPTA